MPHSGDQTPKGGKLARLPIKVVGGAIAVIATVAGVITNFDTIQQFFQPSLSGEWELTNTIEESTFAPFKGLSVTYTLYLNHDGRQITGEGEKIMENGRPIPATAHSPITVVGGVEGSRVTATFVLSPAPDGAARETRGQFDWHVEYNRVLAGKAIRLEGTFRSTGATSRGRSTAVRRGS